MTTQEQQLATEFILIEAEREMDALKAENKRLKQELDFATEILVQACLKITKLKTKDE